MIASKAYIDAVALKLRGSGLIGGTLDTLRALALVDLTQGRDPLDRIKPKQATTALPEAAAAGRRTSRRTSERPDRPR